MTLYNPSYFYVENFILDRIVYEKPLNSPNVVVFAYDSDSVLEPLLTEYLCDFNVLADILLAGGEATEHVIKRISEEVGDENSETISLRIKDLTGCPITIRNCFLKVYRPMEQINNGQWVECMDRDVFYIIETASTQIAGRQQEQYKEAMITAYKDYLKAIDFGLPVHNARAQTGLGHELVFRSASNIYKSL